MIAITPTDFIEYQNLDDPSVLKLDISESKLYRHEWQLILSYARLLLQYYLLSNSEEFRHSEEISDILR